MKKRLFCLLAAVLLLSPLLSARSDGGAIDIPVPKTAGGAAFDGWDKDGIWYIGVSRDDLWWYFRLCACFSSYVYGPADISEGIEVYYLLSPLAPGDAATLFFSENEFLLIRDSALLTPVPDDLLEKRIAFLTRDIRLPASVNTPYALPQFYQALSLLDSVQRQPDRQGQISGFDAVFGGAACWSESYSGVTAAHMEVYTLLMELFNFDVNVVTLISDGNQADPAFLLRYSFDEAEVLVLFRPDAGTADVYYKPGVAWYLFSNGEINDMFGT